MLRLFGMFKSCMYKYSIAFILWALGGVSFAVDIVTLAPFVIDAQGPLLLYYAVAQDPAVPKDTIVLRVRENKPTATDSILIMHCSSKTMAVQAVSPENAVFKTEEFKAATLALSGPASTLKDSDFKAAPTPVYQRLLTAGCDNELLGVVTQRAKSGWLHFVENDTQALYTVPSTARKIGDQQLSVNVRLYELRETQLPTGERINARDATWVLDCQTQQGAVAYENAFERVDNQNVSRASTGDVQIWKGTGKVDLSKLKFNKAGPLQAVFTKTICDQTKLSAR